jgi:hypothetical protein
VDVEAGEVGDDCLHEEAAGADGADDEEIVSDGGDESGDESAGTSESLDDESVEASGIDEFAAHLRIADREDEQNDRYREEGCGGSAAVAQGHRQSRDDDDSGQGRDCRQDEEDDAGRSQCVLLQRARGVVAQICHE